MDNEKLTSVLKFDPEIRRYKKKKEPVFVNMTTEEDYDDLGVLAKVTVKVELEDKTEIYKIEKKFKDGKLQSIERSNYKNLDDSPVLYDVQFSNLTMVDGQEIYIDYFINHKMNLNENESAGTFSILTLEDVYVSNSFLNNGETPKIIPYEEIYPKYPNIILDLKTLYKKTDNSLDSIFKTDFDRNIIVKTLYEFKEPPTNKEYLIAKFPYMTQQEICDIMEKDCIVGARLTTKKDIKL